MERQNPYKDSPLREFPSPGNPIIVEVTRGNSVESRHEVHAVLCDASGNKRQIWGSSDLPIFPRSTVKLIQSLGFSIQPNCAELSNKELAIACATHQGEVAHVELVRGWLKKIGLTESDLECGPQDPESRAAARALASAGERSCPIHNNCSGKHTGMLYGCILCGYDTKGYSNYDHPYQHNQRELLGKFFDLDFHRLAWGIDGCGLPTYSLPLSSLALAQARIADPSKLTSQIQSGVHRAVKAIQREPFFLGGSESLCTKIVTGSSGQAMVKIGAEGVYGTAFPELGLGLAMKSADGNIRAVRVVLANFLRRLHIQFRPGADGLSLEDLCKPKVKNWNGELVGEMRIA